ncbi:DUF2786 domain-containing protein [Paenibacillus maysiensis]|uniref:DUF2786 domain-containing protein n=1 Tax=Paenibacillus maysiensis TaxID=1155954 RepID=UPI00046E9C5B|nr:DUF2786 domain-containing protein [Paenibacillus maysiensis]
MQDAIRKIQKAFKLAENNSNVEEAQAAMLLAQRLMLKHGLATADVKKEQEVAPEATKKSIRKSRVQWWEKRLAGIVAKNFRCYSYTQSGYAIGFLGLPDDVSIAVEVQQFAESAIRHHSGNYLKEIYTSSRREANAIKNDYITGFLQGLHEKFKEQIAKESLSLVLVRHEVVEAAYESAGWKNPKPTTINRMGDPEALAQGYEDGKNFNNPVGKMIN